MDAKCGTKTFLLVNLEVQPGRGSGRLVALADAVKLHCISAVGVLAVTAGICITGGTDGDAARPWLILATN